MIDAQKIAEIGLLSQNKIREALERGLDQKFVRQKVLILIPDHTRSVPLPFLFRSLVGILHDVNQLDFMVALGTHPPLSEESIHKVDLFVIGGKNIERILYNYRLLTSFPHSARAYHRILKLARNIIDLVGCEEIQSAQLAEALQYRPKLMMA